MALECSGVNQHTSTFWSVTLQPVGADQATIWQIEGDISSFHMRHRRLICTKRLQSYGGCINLNNFPLVHSHLPSLPSSHARKSWKSASLCTHEKRESLSAKGRLSHTAELLKMIHDSRIKARESRSCPNGYEDCCARLT